MSHSFRVSVEGNLDASTSLIHSDSIVIVTCIRADTVDRIVLPKAKRLQSSF